MTAIQKRAMRSGSDAALRSRFRGALLRPGEEGYGEARRVWNGTIQRRPALIARCAGAGDVVEAVRFAREHAGLFYARPDDATTAQATEDRALSVESGTR